MDEDDTDVVSIQEPYNIGSTIAGIPRTYTVISAGEGKKRAAIVIKSKQLDAILITQISDEDATVVELKLGRVTLIVASIYFDIKRLIEADLKKMQAVINHAKGITTIFAIDSNSRSTSWNDVLTNKRGRAVEEFITTNQLYIANEESCYTIFQNSRGASNIDLTILNNTAIKLIQERAMHDKESCSDHNIIHYILGNEAFRSDVTNKERRYAVTQKGLEKFQEMVIVTMENIARGSEKADKIDDTLDVVLCRRTSMATTSEAAVEELHSVLD